MEETITILLVSVTGYAATNIDNLLLLVAMHGGNRNARKVVTVGFAIGSLLALAISSLGMVVSTFLPLGYINFLGVIPIVLGARELRLVLRKKHPDTTSPALSANSLIGAATVSLGNSSDTIALFAPLFIETELVHRWVILGGFSGAMITFLWLSHYLSSHPLLTKPIEKVGAPLAPWLMIAIGAYILVNTNTDIIPG